MSPDQNPFVRTFLISVDVRGYSTATEPRQASIQRDLLDILNEAAARAELDRESWPRQSQGDGELAVLTLSTDDVGRVIDRYVPEIASLLLMYNVHRSPADRLRLRVALGHGLAKTAALGYAGNAPIETGRLQDSRPPRRVLDTDRNVDVAVILSESIHRDYVTDLHPRHNDGDEFTVSPWGTSYLAKSTVPASPQSCARTLVQRRDATLVLTSKGAADGGDLGIGGWMCLAVDPSTTAGIQLVGLDKSLPGGAEFAISVWKN